MSCINLYTFNDNRNTYIDTEMARRSLTLSAEIYIIDYIYY